MIFDTDIIIWLQRGNEKAARAVNQENDRFISICTYMELLQLASAKKHHRVIQLSLQQLGFEILPLTHNIGHRASVYIEEYTLSHCLQLPDALIAATAVENHYPLLTGNKKHFKCIKELDLNVFIPQ